MHISFIGTLQHQNITKKVMKNDVTITKRMTDVIVQVCFDIAEFSKLYDESAKDLFQHHDDIKNGLKWFMHSENSEAFNNNIGNFLQSVTSALQLYENLNIPMENKDKIIIQLTNLQKHLAELQNQGH